jgi:hypothetical protein
MDSGTHLYTCIKLGKIIIHHFIPKKETDGAILLPVLLGKDAERTKGQRNTKRGFVRPETAVRNYVGRKQIRQ